MVGIIYVYSSRALIALLNFFCFYIVLNYMGAKQAVDYSYYFTVIAFFTVLIGFGANNSLVSSKDKDAQFYNEVKSILIRAAFFLLVFLIIYIITGDYFYYLSLVLPFFSLISTRHYLRKEILRGVFSGELLKWVVVLFVLILLVVLNIKNVQLVFLISFLLMFFILLRVLVKQVITNSKCGFWRAGINFDGFLVAASSVFLLLMAQVDRVIFKDYFVEEEFVSYLASQMVVSMTVILSGSLVSIYLKEISQKINNKGGHTKRESRVVFFANLILSACVLPFAYLYFSFLKVALDKAFCFLLIMLFMQVVSYFFGIGLTVVQYIDNKFFYFFILLGSLAVQLLFVFLMYGKLGIYVLPIALGLGALCSRIAAWYVLRKKNIYTGIF